MDVSCSARPAFSPPDRDKDTVLDLGGMLVRIPPFLILPEGPGAEGSVQVPDLLRSS